MINPDVSRRLILKHLTPRGENPDSSFSTTLAGTIGTPVQNSRKTGPIMGL